MGSFYREAAMQTKTFAASAPLDDDITCGAEGPGPAARVRIGVGGTLHYISTSNVEDTIEYASGEVDAIEIKTVKSDSTAQKITLYWFQPGN